MTYQVQIAAAAFEDLQQIKDYYDQREPGSQVATAVLGSIFAQIQELSIFPGRGSASTIPQVLSIVFQAGADQLQSGIVKVDAARGIRRIGFFGLQPKPLQRRRFARRRKYPAPWT